MSLIHTRSSKNLIEMEKGLFKSSFRAKGVAEKRKQKEQVNLTCTTNVERQQHT